MQELETFVYSSTVRLSFNKALIAAGTTLSGKLLRNGETYLLENSTVGDTLTMSSDTPEPLPVGKYKFVWLHYTISTNEPLQQGEAEIIIEALK